MGAFSMGLAPMKIDVFNNKQLLLLLVVCAVLGGGAGEAATSAERAVVPEEHFVEDSTEIEFEEANTASSAPPGVSLVHFPFDGVFGLNRRSVQAKDTRETWRCHGSG